MILKSFFSTSTVFQNCYRASLSKIGRPKYVRDYIVEILKADGSIVLGRASEPFHLLQLPVDIKTLNEEERREKLALRKPKAKKIQQETIDDNFDIESYEKLWKN
ncbi:39S ribosomal protein L55, mitochondrial [Strongyloides ratti]|uniref:39S ribosomal protein L55, mitochondrial n=1 Tax=Strongyloides ratti TaxID=34506 RepID=A0A090MXF3_STRRB|nr:39S ribosomal protein L55, mitochondrial [Strongyloides ratti]CEF65334.1 39S ribosomal protein L55, mitochondrial [Strongyloides ratti]